MFISFGVLDHDVVQQNSMQSITVFSSRAYPKFLCCGSVTSPCVWLQGDAGSEGAGSDAALQQDSAASGDAAELSEEESTRAKNLHKRK